MNYLVVNNKPPKHEIKRLIFMKVFENKLITVYFTNKKVVDKEFNENKHRSLYYGIPSKYEIMYNGATSLKLYEVFLNDSKYSDDAYYSILCTIDGHWSIVTYLKDGCFNLNISYDNTIAYQKYNYRHGDDFIIAPDQNIKAYANKKEALNAFNKIKTDAKESIKNIEDNEKNCNLGLYLQHSNISKIGKLGVTTTKSSVKIHLKDVIVFEWYYDSDLYFQAEARWLHKGRWIEDTFKFIEKHKKDAIGDKKRKKSRERVHIDKILSEY